MDHQLVEVSFPDFRPAIAAAIERHALTAGARHHYAGAKAAPTVDYVPVRAVYDVLGGDYPWLPSPPATAFATLAPVLAGLLRGVGRHLPAPTQSAAATYADLVDVLEAKTKEPTPQAAEPPRSADEVARGTRWNRRRDGRCGSQPSRRTDPARAAVLDLVPWAFSVQAGPPPQAPADFAARAAACAMYVFAKYPDARDNRNTFAAYSDDAGYRRYRGYIGTQSGRYYARESSEAGAALPAACRAAWYAFLADAGATPAGGHLPDSFHPDDDEYYARGAAAYLVPARTLARWTGPLSPVAGAVADAWGPALPAAALAEAVVLRRRDRAAAPRHRGGLGDGFGFLAGGSGFDAGGDFGGGFGGGDGEGGGPRGGRDDTGPDTPYGYWDGVGTEKAVALSAAAAKVVAARAWDSSAAVRGLGGMVARAAGRLHPLAAHLLDAHAPHGRHCWALRVLADPHLTAYGLPEPAGAVVYGRPDGGE